MLQYVMGVVLRDPVAALMYKLLLISAFLVRGL
jgi:hypothetical protein